MPAHNEASNIQAGRSRHNPFRTSTQNTGLTCLPVLRINLNCFPCSGCQGYSITTLLDRYAERRCIWRFDQVALVRWRWPLSFSEEIRARTLHLAAGDEWNGVIDACAVIDAFGRHRLASAAEDMGTTVGRIGGDICTMTAT